MRESINELKLKVKKLEQENRKLKKSISKNEEYISILEENEEWFSNIFFNSPLGIALVGKDFKIIDVNNQIVEMFGYKKEEFIGSTFHFITHQEDYLKDYRKAMQVINDDFGSYSIEKRYINKKGDIVWGRLTASKVVDENNDFKFGIAMIEDITSLKKKDLILKESEKKYRHLLENSNEGIFVVQNGFCVYSNPSTSAIIGYTQEEIVSTKLIDYILEEDRTFILDNFKEENYNIIAPHDLRIKRKNGEIIWVYIHCTSINWNNQTAQLCFINDITQRKKAEQELIDSKNTLAFALEGANLAFWDQDFRTGKVIRNEKWAEMLGYKPSDFNGTIDDLNNIIHPDDYSRVKETSNKHKKGEIPVFRVEHRLRAKDGSWKWILNWGKIFERETDGRPKRAIGIHMDISKQKEYEQELVKAKEHAEESDKLKSSFLANMSHEIRTPMNGIIGFSNMLTKKELTHEKRNLYTKIIIDSSKQLLSIVNDILDISRIETGGISINNSRVVINDLINDLFTFFQSMAEDKNIALHSFTALEKRRSRIYTDYVRLRQILTNLLNNAIKFTNNGQITFGYEFKKNELQFFVKDTGIGIAKDMLDVVFERFRQVEDHLIRQYGGTGLGLAISKKLAELLGGNLWVESELGKGSTFYFTLPHKPVDAVVKPINRIPSKNKQTVLVAEDEETNQIYIEELLKDFNINILQARNGIETVEYCKNNPNINLVLMDMKMPKLNGIEATKRILKFRPNLPIVAQTAYTLLGYKEKSFDAGCCDYISKPIDKEKLIYTLEKYLNVVE